MRVSDAEREAAAAELREHFASGRLDQEELEMRLSAVFAARTRGDLSALFTDLPSAGHSRPARGRGPLPARRTPALTGRSAATPGGPGSGAG